ncbi:MAG: hypothetical protein ACLP9K_10265 [Nitrososphaerales archaeon]
MKTAWAIGVVSEILLVAGIILVLYGAGIAYTHSYEICALTYNGGCSYSLGALGPFFTGIAFLVASSIGFLITLRSYRRAPSTPSGTTS